MTTVRRLVTARPWLSVLAVLVVAGAAVTSYVLIGRSGASSAAATVTTRLVSVSTGTVQASVSTTGSFTPADEEDLSFGASSTVTAVKVGQGQQVAKGQVLGTIDPLTLKSALAQAKANLADAQAQLAAAEDDSSATDAQLAADEAAVTTAKSAVAEAQDALAGATLVSPIAGTVAEVNVAVGDATSGSSPSATTGGSGAGGQQSAATATTSSSDSSADFVVIGLKKWTVAATVDDTQVGLIAQGDQVQLTTDGVTSTIFGTVSSVSVLSSSDSGSASYPVSIAITGAPAGLHDGASATASIIYKQVTNVLTVPSAAVHSDGSSSYVYVSKNGAKSKTAVTTGLSSGGTTQIKSGLTSGQQVYVETVSLGRTGSSGNTQRQQGNFPEGGGNFQGGPPAGGFGGGFGGGQQP